MDRSGNTQIMGAALFMGRRTWLLLFLTKAGKYPVFLKFSLMVMLAVALETPKSWVQLCLWAGELSYFLFFSRKGWESCWDHIAITGKHVIFLVTGSWPFYYIKCVEYLYIEESPVILLLFIAHLGLGITLKWWLVCTWTFPPLSQNGSPATHIFRAHDRTWLLKIFSSIYNIYMYVLFVHGVFFFCISFPLSWGGLCSW